MEHNSHNHHHHHDISGPKILLVTILNVIITIAEFIGGILSGSLALLSDSAHNLSDTLAIALSYFAHTVGKKPKNTKKTYGYKRAEVLAAFVNASFLVGISIWLLFEAYNRFRKPETIDSKLMLIVAIIGLLANLFSMILLHRDSHISMNIRSSYLHLLGDTISSVGVIAGGIGIYFWNITWIDPVITVLISIYILIQTRHILVNSINILMQASAPLDYEAIKKDIESLPNINNIHHIHSWLVNENTAHFEAHIDVNDALLSEIQKTYDDIEKLLKDKYGINHITIQAEVNKCCNKNLINT